jgi:hypothetical protein
MSDSYPSKQKKIAIRFFLHKSLEPKLAHLEGKNRKTYPLYIYVTYARKNMQFKSSHSMWYWDMEHVEKLSPGLIDREIKLINQIIRYEAAQLQEGDEYEMKGFKERYGFYSVSIRDAVEKYLKAKLKFEIKRTNSPLWNVLDFNPEAGLIRVCSLYEAAQKLYTNLFEKMLVTVKQELDLYEKTESLLTATDRHDFPSLIDWFDGSFRSKLSSKSQGEARLTDADISVINSLIEKSIEYYKTHPSKKLDE